MITVLTVSRHAIIDGESPLETVKTVPQNSKQLQPQAEAWGE